MFNFAQLIQNQPQYNPNAAAFQQNAIIALLDTVHKENNEEKNVTNKKEK